MAEWLYQVSLGKAPFDADAEARVDQAARAEPKLGMAASLAIALAELRQDLAEAEDSGDTMLATTAKRKVELVEDLMLKAFESLGE